MAGSKVACPQCGQRILVPPDARNKTRLAEPEEVPVVQVVMPEEGGRGAAPGPRDRGAGEKYCIECGSVIRARASVCPQCGVAQADWEERRSKHCHECGAVIRGKAVVCPECGVDQRPAGVPYSEASGAGGNRIAAGVCGILLGGFGVHKFIVGLTTPAIIMVAVSVGSIVLSACLVFPILGFMAMSTIGLVEGIIYLTKTDAEFYRTYVVGKKQWF
jgi:TM2 domain-containing membrane protein YozV/RNA polymerase subunit RPABC4/transcription elongation factor Spt4